MAYQEKVSKHLSKVLRHGEHRTIGMRADGFAPIHEVQNLLGAVSFEEIQEVVQHSTKRGESRFEFADIDGVTHIRALYGHTNSQLNMNNVATSSVGHSLNSAMTMDRPIAVQGENWKSGRASRRERRPKGKQQGSIPTGSHVKESGKQNFGQPPQDVHTKKHGALDRLPCCGSLNQPGYSHQKSCPVGQGNQVEVVNASAVAPSVAASVGTQASSHSSHGSSGGRHQPAQGARRDRGGQLAASSHDMSSTYQHVPPQVQWGSQVSLHTGEHLAASSQDMRATFQYMPPQTQWGSQLSPHAGEQLAASNHAMSATFQHMPPQAQWGSQVSPSTSAPWAVPMQSYPAACSHPISTASSQWPVLGCGQTQTYHPRSELHDSFAQSVADAASVGQIASQLSTPQAHPSGPYDAVMQELQSRLSSLSLNIDDLPTDKAQLHDILTELGFTGLERMQINKAMSIG